MDTWFSESMVTGVYNFMMPFMLVSFVLAIIFRVLIFIVVKCEWRFAIEFEHRVEAFMLDEQKGHDKSFHDLIKELLEKTHYEFYLLKAQKRRRRLDYPVTFFERVFGIIQASERIIEDTLKQTQYVKMQDEPDFDRMARYVFSINPYYNKFLGIVSKNAVDDLLNLFPSLLIICGILGTFVGIVGGIPDLRVLDVTDVQSTSLMLNQFLDAMSFAMTTSILGMFLSLIVSVFNTGLSSYSTYVDLIDLYKNSLAFLWKECNHELSNISSEHNNTSGEKSRYAG